VRDSFLEKIEATVRRYGLLPRGRTVGVAVSGGRDSVALLAALADLAPRRRCKLAVLHVNHGLRGRESGEDARFVRRLAARCGIPFHGTKLDWSKTGRSRKAVSEEWLRERRFEAIERLAREAGAKVVAFGHQRDDLAETVLMRFLRGSGAAGLSGFRPQTTHGRLRFVRPLYDCARDEIVEFCRRRGLRWREDRTNRDTRWLRNRIRHDLFPLLEKIFNPRLRELLADNARWFWEDENYFEIRAREALGLSRRRTRSPKSLSLERIRALEPPLLARLFRVWVMAATAQPYPPPARQIENLIELVNRPDGRGEVRCAAGVTFYVERERLVCWKPAVSGQRFFRPEENEETIARQKCPVLCRLLAACKLPREGRSEIISGDKKTVLRLELRLLNRRRQPKLFEKARSRALHETKSADLEQYFDADRIEGALVVRNRRPGDRFHPLGAPGSKKLKDFLIDLKVPDRVRDRLLVLCDEKNVLWVVGLRTAHSVRLTDKTESVLSFRCHLGRRD
jgi:tRNA(Ile)-lysidine synthase